MRPGTEILEKAGGLHEYHIIYTAQASMQWPSVRYLLQNFTQFFRVITLKGREYKTNWPWHLVLGVFESKKMWAAI